MIIEGISLWVCPFLFYELFILKTILLEFNFFFVNLIKLVLLNYGKWLL